MILTVRRAPHYFPLYRVIGLLGAAAHALGVPAICNSSIYCSGDLLHRVQLARVFDDSKSFVDLRLLKPQNVTLDDFAILMDKTGRSPSKRQLTDFVNLYFADGNEMEPWLPPDFNPHPPVIDTIADPKLRMFAKDIVAIWSGLGRKVSKAVEMEPDQYSFIYVPNGFIVPGGRFREIYYWDSYWIVRGLLISNMTQTAKGVIENLLHLVDKVGYVPNGSRIYYIGRSQPPLLAAMVASYFAATGDLEWLERHLPTVERELQYWLDSKKCTIYVKGKKYVLLRYLAAPTKGPRPESYYEDFTSAQMLPEDLRESFYSEMKSAAESGWDFSTRWFVTHDGIAGNLTNVHASHIVPVDLNSIFARALDLAGNFRKHLKDRREARKWRSLAKYWRSAIDAVLWHPEDGIWYDYDAKTNLPRRHFFTSCLTPLWAGAIEEYDVERYAASVVRYLIRSGVLNYPGGVPTSMYYSGEQWDYPNAWAPLESILIGGLEASGYPEAQRLAREQALVWMRATYLGYSRYGKMFEKYNVAVPGHEGSGGEYLVQDGFGWTNGVALELLQMYGAHLSLDGSKRFY